MQISFEPGEHPGWALGGGQYGLFAQEHLALGAGVDVVTRASTRRRRFRPVNADVDAMQPPYNTHLNHVNPNLGNVAPRVGTAWAPRGHHADGDSRRLRDVLRHGQERHVCGVGRAGRQSSPAGRPAHEHRLEQRDAESLLPRQHRCAGGVPADLQTALRQVMAYAIINNTAPNLAATSVTVNGVTTTLPGVAVTPIPLSVGHIEENLKTPFTRQTIGAQFDLGSGRVRVRRPEVHPGAGPVNSSERQPDDRRPDHDPVFQSLNKLGNGGVLDVKQLLVEVQRSARRQLQVAYALGSATNNSINNLGNGIGGTPATNPFDYSIDQGPARAINGTSSTSAATWSFRSESVSRRSSERRAASE